MSEMEAFSTNFKMGTYKEKSIFPQVRTTFLASLLSSEVSVLNAD